MPAQQVSIGLDISDLQTGTQAFIAALQSQQQAVFELFEKMVQFNKQGQETRKVIQGFDDDGNKYEATLKKIASGWEVVNAKATASLSALQKAQDAAYKAASAQNADTGESLIRGSYNLAGFDPAKTNQVESAIQKIRKILGEGSISVQRFQDLLNQLRLDPSTVIAGLTETEQKVTAAIRTIQKAQDAAFKKTANTANNANADTGEQIIKSSFNLNAYDPTKASQVEAAISRIRTILASGTVSVQRFQELLNTLKMDPSGVISGLTKAEQQVVASLRTVQNAGERLGHTFISLGGILRLLEAQVLKRIFATIESEILQSVTAAQKFMVQIAEIRTISQDSGVTTKQWSEGLTELSSRFGNTQADVAEAAYQALSNQVVKGTDTFQFLATAMQFGQTTVTSATDSVNLLSGAMRSFNLPASEAERISGILFETINLGRVRGKEMADTFGRIGTLAADAGVKLEDTAAAIAVLTNRGMKFSDASTLLQNLILKLVRPTEEMKKLLAEWGVASGTAAIATFGFQGVLERLNVEAQKGTSRIGELTGQMRALRSVVGLTGGSFDDFKVYKDKITNSSGTYNNAKQELAQSPGQQALKEFTTLRNFFEQGFGEPFLRVMLQITNSLGGMKTILTAVVNGVQLAAGAFLAWQAIQIANLPIMATNITLTGTWAAVQGGLTAAFTTTTAATVSFAAAAWAALTPILLLTASFAAGAYLGYLLFIQQSTEKMSDLRNAANRMSDEAARKREETTKAEVKSAQDVVEQTKVQYNSRFQALLNYSTQVLKLSNDMKQKAIDNLKDVTEALKISAGSYFESLRKRVSDFTSVASESKQMIKASLKESEDLPRRGSDKIFNEKLKYASSGYQTDQGVIIGDQKIDLIKKRITELSEKAREEFSLGTKEGADEARKLFNEVEKLQTQLFDQETEKQKKIFDFNVKKGFITPVGTDADGKPRYEFTVKTAELEKQINATTEERLALENSFRQAQELRKADAVAMELAERERIRALQQQFMLLEKIDIFNKAGKIKDEYKGIGGAQRALGEFDERRTKILELAGTDPEKGFQVFSDLFKQRAALIQTIVQASNAESTEDIQGRVTKDIQNVNRLAAEAKEKIKSLTDDIKPILSGINQQIEVFQQKILGTITEPVNFDQATRQLQKLKDAKAAFDAPGGRTVDNAAAVKKESEALVQLTLDYYRLRDIKGVDKPIPGDTSSLTVRDQLNGLEDKGSELLKTAVGLEVVKKQQADAQSFSEKLLADFQKLPGAMEAMQKAATDVAPSVNANFKSLAETAGSYAAELERINNALRTQQELLPNQRGKRDFVGPPAPGEMFGAVNYYSAGFVPRGSDQNPAMIADGESIITARATAQFAPLLKAMNDGILPRTNQSSTVTNVGDITVNVSGGHTDEQSIRNIAQGMRRAIRRGQVTL